VPGALRHRTSLDQPQGSENRGARRPRAGSQTESQSRPRRTQLGTITQLGSFRAKSPRFETSPRFGAPARVCDNTRSSEESPASERPEPRLRDSGYLREPRQASRARTEQHTELRTITQLGSNHPRTPTSGISPRSGDRRPHERATAHRTRKNHQSRKIRGRDPEIRDNSENRAGLPDESAITQLGKITSPGRSRPKTRDSGYLREPGRGRVSPVGPGRAPRRSGAAPGSCP
jgi:hypothetical protein